MILNENYLKNCMLFLLPRQIILIFKKPTQVSVARKRWKITQFFLKRVWEKLCFLKKSFSQGFVKKFPGMA
jgi:hypothetical protein